MALALGLMMSLMLFPSGTFAQRAATSYNTGQASTHVVVPDPQPGNQQILQQTGFTRPLANLANTARAWKNSLARCRRVFTWRRVWWRGAWRWRRGWVTVCR